MKWFLCIIVLVSGGLTFGQITVGENMIHEKFTKFPSLEQGDLKIQKITNNTYMHTSFLNTEEYGKVACNGLIVIDQREAVVYDTPPSSEVSVKLINWIADTLKANIIAVIPTHFHIDCLGGLRAFHEKGIPSWSSSRTRELAQSTGVAVPENGFSDQIEIKVGDHHTVAYFGGEGHTQDNIVGFYEKDSVLFGGCLVKSMGAGKGNLSDANIDVWSATILKVEARFPLAEYIVPGHGNPGGRSLLHYTKNLFNDGAILLSLKGDVISHDDHPGKQPTMVYEVEANAMRGYKYQLLSYENGFKSIVILKDEIVEFEFLASAEKANIDIEAINKQRAKWIELCNQHIAPALVENLYFKDAIYYNHKPLVVGHEAITADYQYMNNPQYTLKLEPLTIEKVSPSVVYEIGQCSGSYNGKYILVWKKNEMGVWQIFMDSNI